MAPRKIAFNLKTGRVRGRSRRVLSEADKFARTKKQLRDVLQQNKDLACALEAARARILKLESGKERHDKVYGLCLPQIKAWTEDNMKQVQTILENSLRSIRLVADILTPSQDLTLAEDGDDTGQELLQRSLHPPGSQLVGCPDLMVVEEEEGETDGAEDGDGTAQETQILLSSKVTVRSRRRRHSSPTPESSDEEAAVSPPKLRLSSYESPGGAVQSPSVFECSGSVCLPDEEADERISVAGRATTASPLRELDINEYTMVFGSRPKIARTPERGGSPSSRPEPLPPPRIRMFDRQSSSKQTTSKGGAAAARKQKTLKLSLPKVRRSRTTRPASPPAAGVEGQPANGKGRLLGSRHLATNENEDATPSDTSVPNALGPPASPPLPKDAPEPLRPATPSLACRRSSRVQGLPGGTGESEWADEVDAAEVVPPTRRSSLKGSTARRASLPSKNRLTFVVPNQVPAGSRRSSSGRPTAPPVETPPADSPPAATSCGASRRSSRAGVSRKVPQEEQQRGKRDLEDSELLQPATPSPVGSSSEGTRPEGAGEAEWADEVPEVGPPTRSLKGSTAGKAPKSCQSTFFLPKPAGVGSLEGPKATPVEAPDGDLLSVLTVRGTPGHSSGDFRKSQQRLQQRKSAKTSNSIGEAAFVAEEAESAESQYSTDEDDGAARSGRNRRRRVVTSYKEPPLNRKMRRT